MGQGDARGRGVFGAGGVLGVRGDVLGLGVLGFGGVFGEGKDARAP